MGSQFSSLEHIKKNRYLNRLIDVEHIDENDPFWNQLLSFNFDLPFTKSNSKLLDESIALDCQKFHQNNLKSGNYGSLIRVFCRISNETRKMSDNQLMILQTSNALLIIRCYTKYIIEIENETALLEQMSYRSQSEVANQEQEPEDPDLINQISDLNIKKQSIDLSADSLNGSPRRLYNPNRMYRARKNSIKLSQEGNLIDSQENSIDNESDNESVQILSSNLKNNKAEDILYQLTKNIFQILIDIPVSSNTYNLHLEALNTLLILLTVQMYTRAPTHESLIFETFMLKMDRFVSEFVKVLLTNIIQQMPIPTSQNLTAYVQPTDDSSQRSFMSSVASGLWSVMTLGLGSSSSQQSDKQNQLNNDKKTIITYLPSLPNDNSSNNSNTNDNQIDCSSRLLAWQSCHILLVLSNHCTNESLYNPYRLALFHFTDTQDTPTNIPNSEPLPWFSIDFTKLFHMFTFTFHTDQYTLLLYMLLHRNQHFKLFILSRLNIDLLMIPILKVVFTAPERNSHHIYMALIILLILSEDDIFNKTIHNIPIRKLNWYTERNLSEVSLGGLLILVVIRTIQFNMTRMRDKYLHTNCLAALANMSSKFLNLHPYVCQRINSLFNLLTKKRTKIITQINEENAKLETDKVESNNSQDLLQDLAIIEELMRMVLEIINSCLTNNLHHNSNLIYSILYHKNIFTQFRDHPTFQDVIQNIDTIITSFSHEIEHIEDKSIENLKQIIDLGVKQFPRDRFRKFPELKFKYVEEDQPEEFFVPYVWSLVYKYSNLFWVDHSINLLGQQPAN